MASYNDGLTATVGNGYDRLGRKISITNGTTVTTLTYNDAGQMLMETNHSSGTLGAIAVVSTYDSLLRRTGVTVYNGATALFSSGYAYDAASRLLLVLSRRDCIIQPKVGTTPGGPTLGRRRSTPQL